MKCVCNDMGDVPEFATEKIVVARKTHKCCECNEMILPGQKYEKVNGKWDGQFSTFKTCITCHTIRQEHCSWWVYGSLREDLRECLGLDYVNGEDSS